MKYVFGHKNPDTDSILSSIVYSKFLDKNDVECTSVKLGDINNETKHILDLLNIEEPITKTELEDGANIILMDHNEESQTIDNLEKYNILQIIDHHKFNIKTGTPLFIRAEPVGSTCTIVAKMMAEAGDEISKTDAMLLISGIISDTLYFRSPTTTDTDKEIVGSLNKIAKIDDLEKYSIDLFNAKSDLGDIDVEKLIKLDYKVFEFGGNKYGVGVMETTNPDYALSKKDEIISKMNEIKQNDGLKSIFLSIVDILNEENTTIFPSDVEKELLVDLFDAKIDGNLADLGSRVSRKKQIVPVMEEKLN